MIGIIDYGVGNIGAIANIYKRANVKTVLVRTPEDLAAADRFILPGVGSFDWAMQRFNRAGLRGALAHLVSVERRPVLGICVGMQMMARSSEEGAEPGLSWIGGVVRRIQFPATGSTHILPHMGWNSVVPVGCSPLFRGIDDDAMFYFLHSYCFVPASDASILATTDYGGRFACAAAEGNCYGVQFHPEKSHRWGIKLLMNFAEIVSC